MKINKKAALKGTAGTTAFGGLLAGIIVPAVELNKVQEENELLKRQLRNAQEPKAIPVPAPAETKSTEPKEDGDDTLDYESLKDILGDTMTEEIRELKEKLEGTRELAIEAMSENHLLNETIGTLSEALEAESSENAALKDFLNQNDKLIESLKEQIKTLDDTIATFAEEIATKAKTIKDQEDELKARQGGINIKNGTIKSLQKKVKEYEEQLNRNKRSLELLDKIQKKNPLTAPSGCWLSTDGGNIESATKIAMNCPGGFYNLNGTEAPGTFTFGAEKDKDISTFEYFKKLYNIYSSGTIQSGR